MRELAPLNYGFKSYDGLSGFFLDAKPSEERSWYGSLGMTQGSYSPLGGIVAEKNMPAHRSLDEGG